jgi:hypothetical protein
MRILKTAVVVSAAVVSLSAMGLQAPAALGAAEPARLSSHEIAAMLPGLAQNLPEECVAYYWGDQCTSVVCYFDGVASIHDCSEFGL